MGKFSQEHYKQDEEKLSGIFYEKLKVKKELRLYSERWMKECVWHKKQVVTRPGGKGDYWWPSRRRKKSKIVGQRAWGLW